MNTIWAISSGSYSDYRVLCVVDGTKADAEELAQRMRGMSDDIWTGSDVSVEALAFVRPDVQPVEILHMRVTVWDNGTTSEERTDVRREWPFDPLYESGLLSWRWVRAPIHKGKGGRLEVMGTDHERVRRVFSDRRAQLMAEDAFRLSHERKGRR